MTVQAPETDEDVPRFVAELGIPGLFDVHTHFLPRNLMERVWAYFDAGGELVGRRWPVRYREDEQRRVERLRGLRVRRFSALVYPHKPGMAEWLNGWAADFAARTPGCLRSATFFPEPSARGYVARALDDGVEVFKAHIQVGGYDPRDELLDPVWGMLAEAGVPVVAHCGDYPVPTRYTGAAVFAEVLARHPGLTVIVAHAGAPEYEAFLDLAAGARGVYLDTTMVFTEWAGAMWPWPASLIPRLRELAGRVLLGSDFPNIPYPYAHQLAGLVRLDLGDDWLRAVCHDNAARLFGG